MTGFATLLRSPCGILINDTTIQVADILHNLMRLPGMSSATANELLNPADKQNVPKAVNLVRSLVRLKTLPDPLNPTDSRRRHTLIFLAQVLDFFVLPFINIEMTLSQQIRSLSAYAHLAVAMYLGHGLAFLTGALYADSQAIVKNIIFCVARLQIISGDLEFFIIHEGTDRLETIFSDVRTQDQNRNFDILQLSQKLSVGAAISATFERHPDLDRGHRKLAVKDAKGIDHVNPKSWKGNVRVGQVELTAEWIGGQIDANELLATHFGEQHRVDFPALWSQPGIDLLRPLRSDKYIGSQWTSDDERSERVLQSDSEGIEKLAVPDALAEDEDDNYDDLPIGMDIEDFLDADAAPDSEDAVASGFDKFLVVDNKKYMKSSVVTAMLSSKRARKVTIRTLRARGITLEDLRRPTDNWNSADLVDTDVIKSGDLAACLVRSGKIICLAVIEISSFEYLDPKRQVTSVAMDEVEGLSRDNRSKITVLAQVMDMEATSESEWIWTQRYIRFESVKGPAICERSSQHNFMLRIPAPLIFPLSPSVVNTKPSAGIMLPPPEKRSPLTWSLKTSELEEVLDYAWLELKPDSEDIMGNIEMIPCLGNSMLPYRNQDGES
jgi:hypothetical protein